MENKLEKLGKWALDNGGKFSHGIKLGEIEGYGYGGIVSESLKTGDIMLSIPLSISLDPIKAQEELSLSLSLPLPFTKEEQSNNFNLEVIYLYLFLIHEKRKGVNSFYHPYIDCLPSTFPNFPLTCFSYEEQTNSIIIDPMLNVIKGTNLSKSMYSMFKKLVSLYLYLKTHKNNSLLSSILFEEELVWSFMIIWSRAFPIYRKLTKNDEIKYPVPTLLPFIDILNHQPETKREFIVDKNFDFFTLKTSENILKENNKVTQVFNNYGIKSNDSFLQSYGFIVSNNPHTSFYLQLGGNKKNNNNNTKPGFYLQKIGVNKLPFLNLLNSIQMNNNNNNEKLTVLKNEEEFKLENIDSKSISVLIELFINKISDFCNFRKSENNTICFSLFENNNLISNNNNNNNILKNNLMKYKSEQFEILKQSIDESLDLLSLKSKNKRIRNNSNNNNNNKEIFFPPSKFIFLFDKNDKNKKNEEVMYCHKNEFKFLNYLNDDEVKLSIFLMFKSLELNNYPFLSKFLEEKEEFLGNNNNNDKNISKPLILYDLKFLESKISNFIIFDEILGIHEELKGIFTEIKRKCEIYFSIQKYKSNVKFSDFFKFDCFLYWFSVVERFSVRSFEFLFVILKPEIFEFKERQKRKELHHYFLKNEKIFILYENNINNNKEEEEIEGEEKDEYFLKLDVSSSDVFRKYGFLENNNEKDQFPVDISFPNPLTNKLEVQTTYLKESSFPFQMKQLLEKVYRFKKWEDLRDTMIGFINQILVQLKGSVNNINNSKEKDIFWRFKRNRIRILEKNILFCKNNQFFK